MSVQRRRGHDLTRATDLQLDAHTWRWLLQAERRFRCSSAAHPSVELYSDAMPICCGGEQQAVAHMQMSVQRQCDHDPTHSADLQLDAHTWRRLLRAET